MRTPSDDRTSPARASSHLRLSAATDLYVRFAAAEAVVIRRLRQIAAAETALVAADVRPPARDAIEPPAVPAMPGQFTAEAERKRARSTAIVRASVARLKAGKCNSRSPSKAEIVEISRDLEIDRRAAAYPRTYFAPTKTASTYSSPRVCHLTPSGVGR